MEVQCSAVQDNGATFCFLSLWIPPAAFLARLITHATNTENMTICMGYEALCCTLMLILMLPILGHAISHIFKAALYIICNSHKIKVQTQK